MSIKAAIGIPIVPQPLPLTDEAVFVEHASTAVSSEAEGAEVSLAITAETTVLASTSGSDKIEFPTSMQQRTLWCWAACARMVLRSLDRNVRQCRIAQSLLEQDCCASSCGPDCCNEGCSEDDVLTVYQSFDVEADFHDGQVTFTKLKKEISEERLPLHVAIDWPGDNGGHMIVVNGWSREQSVRRVTVKDPLHSGEGEIMFEDLRTYQGGRWVFTWTGFR